MDLTEFLLARIAEDEYFGTHDRHLAKRWDAECEAKRRIVALTSWPGVKDSLRDVVFQAAITAAIRQLALPYEDHPDYRDEWRP